MGQLSAGGYVAQTESNVRASVGQRQRYGTTQATSRAGNQCNVVCEIKSGECVHGGVFVWKSIYAWFGCIVQLLSPKLRRLRGV